MALITMSSPHAHGPTHTPAVMRDVLLATVPGVIALSLVFGWGALLNIALAMLVALAVEAAVLAARRKPVSFALRDGSALVTAVLLGCALPPLAPWWLVAIATGFAILFGKQLYGGLGMNPFNPAMLGYVLALVSFPVEMTRWLVPADHGGGIAPFLATLQAKLGIAALPDLYSGATPLDAFRHLRGNAEAQAGAQALQGTLVAAGWEWVNLAFLAGGLYLLARRVITWHIPVAMLTALALLALPFWLIDDTRYASPLFHLLTGGTMLGAFFIATDPVTAATSRTGRLIYAAAIGALVWTIRSLGGYPDAIAFSVLLLNLAAPAIDYYTQPRTYGHAQAARGLARKDGGK